MEHVTKILVVDDEQDLCEILQFNLETEGYKVDIANSAEEAMDFPLKHYDLFLLDVMMGEISGFQFAKELKTNASTKDIPVIFITALDDEDNLIKGFNLGADDYITKPISAREIKARVKAVLRRGNHQTDIISTETTLNTETSTTDDLVKTDDTSIASRKESLLESGKLSLNLQTKTVWIDNSKIETTKLEFDLLRVFLENKGVVFSREELLCRVWTKNSYVTDRTVDVNITRLRKKIGECGNNIKTRIGFGYYFDEVEK